MRSKSIFVFFVVVFLVSCASPEPQPTVTVVPSSTHTAMPTSTETPEPTPTVTATPDPLAKLPEEMRRLIGDGTFQWDEENQLAYERKTGLVQGYIGLDGEWYPTPGGNVAIPAGDGSGAPPLEVPIYASIQDALWGVTAELPWGERMAYAYREKIAEENALRADRYWRPAREAAMDAGVALPLAGRQLEVSIQTSESDKSATIYVGELGFVDGTVFTRITYASRGTGYSFVTILVKGDTQTIYQGLLERSNTVYVPGPDEVRTDN